MLCAKIIVENVHQEGCWPRRHGQCPARAARVHGRSQISCVVCCTTPLRPHVQLQCRYGKVPCTAWWCSWRESCTGHTRAMHACVLACVRARRGVFMRTEYNGEVFGALFQQEHTHQGNAQCSLCHREEKNMTQRETHRQSAHKERR